MVRQAGLGLFGWGSAWMGSVGNGRRGKFRLVMVVAGFAWQAWKKGEIKNGISA